MGRKLKEVATLQEAMDNLSIIAEMDMSHPPLLGIVQGTRFITDERQEAEGSVLWLSSEGKEPILDILDQAYRTVHQHLISLYENPTTDWESKKLEQGIAAMMSLVGESAGKMDLYLAFRLGKNEDKEKEGVAKRNEFRALQHFYLRRFLRKFGKGVEGEEAWSEEWAENAEALPSSMSGLKDFETVRRDQEYELFYIRNEEGKPYFNNELLRNIKLTVDFESTDVHFEEDPILKIRAMQDRDLQASANQILGECHRAIEEFFKIAKKLEEHNLSKMLSAAVLALFLAANPRNLLQNTTGKSCLQYFTDFIAFLRAAMRTGEYQKWIAYPPDRSDKAAIALLSLTHRLCRGLFFRAGGIRQEAVGLIHRIVRRGEEIFQSKKQPLLKGDNVWNQLLLNDEHLRALLAKFPNGPLFKVLDLIREEQDEDRAIAFDPLIQENLPGRLYQINLGEKSVSLIRLPSPVRQAQIHRCDIIDEFRGFLRALGEGALKGKHLIVNFNDRTSWREFARSRAIEALHTNAEFTKPLLVVTLPKDTDFYYQNNEYLDLNKASDFIDAFRSQLASFEECGFFFPSSWKRSEIIKFADEAFISIHKHFFQSKEKLSRRNREDFIEIFYQFLILKALEELQPDSISFTCKDALDIGAAQAATFYGFLKLLHADFSKVEERDFLLWLFYTPALFIRERGIDPERLNRSLSILEQFDAELASHEELFFRDFGKLYGPQFLQEAKVTHL